MLKQNTIELLERIKSYSLFKGIGADLTAKIESATFSLGDKLHIDGKKVEAINYPDLGEIVIEQSFCDKITTVSPSSLGMLLHEYLGLARLDDSEFQISEPFVKSLKKQNRTHSIGVDSFNSVQLNTLCNQFKNALPYIDDESHLGRFNTRCMLQSEVNGHRETFQTRETSFGVLATEGFGGEKISRFILREFGQGLLVGEWVVLGNTLEETIQLGQTTHPVAATSLFALVIGYSTCQQVP